MSANSTTFRTPPIFRKHSEQSVYVQISPLNTGRIRSKNCNYDIKFNETTVTAHTTVIAAKPTSQSVHTENTTVDESSTDNTDTTDDGHYTTVGYAATTSSGHIDESAHHDLIRTTGSTVYDREWPGSVLGILTGEGTSTTVASKLTENELTDKGYGGDYEQTGTTQTSKTGESTLNTKNSSDKEDRVLAADKNKREERRNAPPAVATDCCRIQLLRGIGRLGGVVGRCVSRFVGWGRLVARLGCCVRSGSRWRRWGGRLRWLATNKHHRRAQNYGKHAKFLHRSFLCRDLIWCRPGGTLRGPLRV